MDKPGRLLEDDATLTPAALAGKLQASAIDVTGRGAASGCDARTGSGLIDAGSAPGAGDAAPTADAGADRSVQAGDTVTLDGSASTDDGMVRAFQWRQVGGARAALTNAGGAQVTFEAPGADTTMTFELRVTDAACRSGSDRVAVEVDDPGGGTGAIGPLLFVVLAAAFVNCSIACPGRAACKFPPAAGRIRMSRAVRTVDSNARRRPGARPLEAR